MASFDDFVGTATAMGGNDLSRSWLKELWEGADGDMNRAINHLLDTPEEKYQRSSKKRADKAERGSSGGSSRKSKRGSVSSREQQPADSGSAGANAGGGVADQGADLTSFFDIPQPQPGDQFPEVMSGPAGMAGVAAQQSSNFASSSASKTRTDHSSAQQQVGGMDGTNASIVDPPQMDMGGQGAGNASTNFQSQQMGGSRGSMIFQSQHPAMNQSTANFGDSGFGVDPNASMAMSGGAGMVGSSMNMNASAAGAGNFNNANASAYNYNPMISMNNAEFHNSSMIHSGHQQAGAPLNASMPPQQANASFVGVATSQPPSSSMMMGSMPPGSFGATGGEPTMSMPQPPQFGASQGAPGQTASYVQQSIPPGAAPSSQAPDNNVYNPNANAVPVMQQPQQQFQQPRVAQGAGPYVQQQAPLAPQHRHPLADVLSMPVGVQQGMQESLGGQQPLINSYVQPPLVPGNYLAGNAAATEVAHPLSPQHTWQQAHLPPVAASFQSDRDMLLRGNMTPPRSSGELGLVEQLQIAKRLQQHADAVAAAASTSKALGLMSSQGAGGPIDELLQRNEALLRASGALYESSDLQLTNRINSLSPAPAARQVGGAAGILDAAGAPGGVMMPPGRAGAVATSSPYLPRGRVTAGPPEAVPTTSSALAIVPTGGASQSSALRKEDEQLQLQLLQQQRMLHNMRNIVLMQNSRLSTLSKKEGSKQGDNDADDWWNRESSGGGITSKNPFADAARGGGGAHSLCPGGGRKGAGAAASSAALARQLSLSLTPRRRSTVAAPGSATWLQRAQANSADRMPSPAVLPAMSPRQLFGDTSTAAAQRQLALAGGMSNLSPSLAAARSAVAGLPYPGMSASAPVAAGGLPPSSSNGGLLPQATLDHLGVLGAASSAALGGTTGVGGGLATAAGLAAPQSAYLPTSAASLRGGPGGLAGSLPPGAGHTQLGSSSALLASAAHPHLQTAWGASLHGPPTTQLYCSLPTWFPTASASDLMYNPSVLTQSLPAQPLGALVSSYPAVAMR
ncbi:unnamed protein product [Amoebophrya sp. A25]|nr:unnamed protein product [Amoebophrya sp. A25]|eukprot:GSA25T00000215001.1